MSIPKGRWLARLGYALRRHGPFGVIWLAGYNIVYHFARRNRGAGGLMRIDAFDEIHGTDTGGTREIGSLDVVNAPSARYAVRYDPSSAEKVRTQLDRLTVEYSEFSFIDFGSGKGRVLLVAAGFPFKEVLGIEFSRELHDIAVKNIALLAPDARRAGSVRSIEGDAALFEPPQSNLVCYFYNPFGAPILKSVAARLSAHHKRYGYRVIIIYVDPRHAEAFTDTGSFVMLDESRDALILDTRPASAADATPEHRGA